MVVLNSLNQVERPRLRRMLANNEVSQAKLSLVRYRAVNIVFWIINCIAAAIVLTLFSDIYWKDASTLSALLWATLFIALVRGSRSVSSTYSVFLQAADRFKALSLVTLKSSLLTIPVVFLILQYFPPEFSLIGILIGEVFAFILLLSLYSGVKS
ncbi:hypothetical protein GCM10010982_04800 [Bowmanella pacifica]|uniref:Uncharacterized protein n=2 Tax=Bowmanella pacifica TaxID=502051 RepID=A0A917YRU9_9ALTE|nr:hypothetical protein GCM10010982_04800 [Bowmanella pacifica]